MWARYLYLEGKCDLRRAKRKVQFLKEEFRAAAHRAARPGLARLVRLDLNRSPAPEAPAAGRIRRAFSGGVL